MTISMYQASVPRLINGLINLSILRGIIQGFFKSLPNYCKSTKLQERV